MPFGSVFALGTYIYGKSIKITHFYNDDILCTLYVDLDS